MDHDSPLRNHHQHEISSANAIQGSQVDQAFNWAKAGEARPGRANGYLEMRKQRLIDGYSMLNI